MKSTQLATVLILGTVFCASAAGLSVRAKNQTAGLASGQADKDAKTPAARASNLEVKRPAALVSLIGDVRSAFPEFAADMLIAISDPGRIAEKEWRKELLEEAFNVAFSAQYPMPMRPVGPYPVDTMYGYLGQAFKLKLDTLSLQCRVVRSMVSLDKAKARTLFSSIDRLRFTPLSCSDGLVPEVSDYYETAAKLEKEAFSPQERSKGKQIQFLESLVLDLSSPVQLAPMAEVLESSDLSPSQRQNLVAQFSAALGSLRGDDRSFASSSYTAPWEIAKLGHVCKVEGIPTKDLTWALREYYVRHFSAERCADTLRVAGDTDQAALPSAVRDFNKRLATLDEKDIQEISADEVKSSQIKGSVNPRIYWQTPPSSEMMQGFKRLRFRASRTKYTLAEKETDEWKHALNEYLMKFSAWKKGEDESNEEHFHQKCEMFEGLVEDLPPWPERGKIVMDFIGFLGDFDLARGSRIEWYWRAKSLLDRVGRLAGTEAAATLRKQLESSGNPVLYLYSQVQEMVSSGVKKDAARN